VLLCHTKEERGQRERSEAHKPSHELKPRHDVGDALRQSLRQVEVSPDEVRNTLTLPPSGAATRAALRQEAETLAAWLRVAQAAATAVAACPRPCDAEAMAKSESATSFATLKRDFGDAIRRHAAGRISREALAALAQWMKSDWVAACEAAIVRRASNASKLVKLQDAVPTPESYQRFRARANDLDPSVMTIFSILREAERSLRAVPAEVLEDQVRHMIQREALLAWKGRLETAWPVLLVEKEELRRKIETLADLDKQFRKLNRDLLAEDFDLSRLSATYTMGAASVSIRCPVAATDARSVFRVARASAAFGDSAGRPIAGRVVRSEQPGARMIPE
jgi:hypothetical protein